MKTVWSVWGVLVIMSVSLVIVAIQRNQLRDENEQLKHELAAAQMDLAAAKANNGRPIRIDFLEPDSWHQVEGDGYAIVENGKGYKVRAVIFDRKIPKQFTILSSGLLVPEVQPAK